MLALTGANEDCHSLVEMGNWGPALNLVSCCIRRGVRGGGGGPFLNRFFLFWSLPLHVFSVLLCFLNKLKLTFIFAVKEAQHSLVIHVCC